MNNISIDGDNGTASEESKFFYTQQIHFDFEVTVSRENRERSERNIFIDIYIRNVAYMAFKFFLKADVCSGKQPLVAFFLFVKHLLQLRGVFNNTVHLFLLF